MSAPCNSIKWTSRSKQDSQVRDTDCVLGYLCAPEGKNAGLYKYKFSGFTAAQSPTSMYILTVHLCHSRSRELDMQLGVLWNKKHPQPNQTRREHV